MKKNLLLTITCLFLAVALNACGTNDDSAQQTTIFVPSGQGNDEGTTTTFKLVNPNATAEAKALFKLLADNYGKRILSGVVARIDWNTDEAENVYAWTGKYPAINVFDFINIHASKDVNPNGWLDYSDMAPVKAWHDRGGIVGCMWHWQVRANNGSNMTCSPGNNPGETSFNPECIRTTSSADYKQLIHDLDQVAGYLKTMQNMGIAVLWRPLHEASGNTFEFEGGKAWFWWGSKGGEAYKALWRFMYDYLVNKKGLNNLIWIWNSQMGDKSWYPGDDVVDIVGRDSYYALQYPLFKEYTQLVNDFPGKMITLAECGNGDEVNMSPLSKIWAQGSRWSWFMTWYDAAYEKGDDEHQFAGKQWWQDAFSQDYVLTRESISNR